MFEDANTKNSWLVEIRNAIDDIRNWSIWREDPLRIMRSKSGGFDAGALALYTYFRYVRRFTIIMCDVLSKAPETDDRFWRLAVNLHDELGGTVGFRTAHGKLIAQAAQRPATISDKEWNRCVAVMETLEKESAQEFASLSWPLNLFALGPGTESISDLFLEPLQAWSSDALASLPQVQSYFDAHRPEVEYEHQMEISRVLAEELNDMPKESAESLFGEGKRLAERVAIRHYKATCLCWQVSNSKNISVA